MKITDATFVIIDTETGGLDPSVDDLLEIYARQVNVASGNGVFISSSHTLLHTYVKPTKPIPKAVSAIHHLLDGDPVFANAPRAEIAKAKLEMSVPLDAIMVAQHAPFDRGFVDPALADRRWLCTKRLAQKVVPEAENFHNATIYYTLGGPKITYPLHGARADVKVTRFNLLPLLQRFLQSMPDDVDALLAFVDAPIVMATMPFGKHKGKAFSEIPTSYFDWCFSPAGLTDMNADLRWNMESELRDREREYAQR